MEPETQNVDRANEGSAGPIIGTIIILIVIVLGGLYFWGQSDNARDTTENSGGSVEMQNDADASVDAGAEATTESDLGDESTL